jgi:hypothetical protein
MPTPAKILLVAAGAALALTACKRQETDNPDVAAGYRGDDQNHYEGDIVTARKRNEYEDQGKGINPATLNAIEDSIRTVYLRDLERCLEDEMATHDTRFLRSVFTVEFHIDTDGRASDAKILKIWVGKQNAKGANVEDLDATQMTTCIGDMIGEWEFEPAPEVEYVHTYQGQVGEAF